MAAAVAMAPAMPARTATPPPHLTLNTSSRGTPAAIPNKHLPVCTPGPRRLPQSPASVVTRDAVVLTSLLSSPADQFMLLLNEPPIYSIDARTLHEALDHLATQPLPDPKSVFPWLHGLHAENQMQLAYFVSRKKSLRKVPQCLRGITIVKADGDLTRSKLKGAIAPEELLLAQYSSPEPSFIEIDPKDGFSVRNFQIQACKMATISDIVIYGDGRSTRQEVVDLAKRVSKAQMTWRESQRAMGNDIPELNTFVVTDPFSTFEKHFRDIVAIDSTASMTGEVMDFFHWERLEMCTMSKASEICRNVFLGPSPDPAMPPADVSFDIFIECSDAAHLPDLRYLSNLQCLLEDPKHRPLSIEFASSGSILPPTWSQVEVDSLMDTCRWIYEAANAGEADDMLIRKDSVGDICMMTKAPRSQKILIHCSDGYTESSLLGLAYMMYAEGLPVHEAWIKLHCEKGRNFFAYPSDVALLRAIQPRILQESPCLSGDIGSISSIVEPRWLTKIDGSLPSRILPYMYLGNLNHANNPALLKELGISRILSVGEAVSWSNDVLEAWGPENLLYIDRVQDNGVDPLTDEFERCLKFIEQGKIDGKATLVHCRVGVSRSATICIAEVMNELGLSFPRAYCFVRARRLNVIIQPHLRFTYELLKWEEYQRLKRKEPLRRELEWASVSREIALMNKPYSRQQ